MEAISEDFPLLDSVPTSEQYVRKARDPQPLTLALINKLNTSAADRETKTADEIADVLLESVSLHLEFANLTGPVASLDCFSNLKEIYLQGNGLTEISDGFSLCLSLKRVFLGLNRISVLEGLEHLVNLEVLDLSQNAIEELPGNYKKVLPSTNLMILDLKGNPATATEEASAAHRRAAVKALPKVTIIDGLKVTAADGKEVPEKLFITVPMEEDDGSEAQPVQLSFAQTSDLWSVAEKFCVLHDITGVLARRQLVVWMKNEARDVFGVTVQDGEVTRAKLEETKGMDEEDDEEEEGKEAEEEGKEAERDSEAAAAAKPFALPDRSAAVQLQTDRAMSAVNSFMADFDDSYAAAASSLNSAATSVAEKSHDRVEKFEVEQEVSAVAVTEAKTLLAERIEKIKAEKLEALRKKKEFMKETEDARMKMIEGANEQLKLLKDMRGAKKAEEGKQGELDEAKEMMMSERESDEDDDDWGEEEEEEEGVAQSKSKAAAGGGGGGKGLGKAAANQATRDFDERMRKLGLGGSSDIDNLNDGDDDLEFESYMMDELKENYENQIVGPGRK
jgi:hypothetical protein